MELISHIYTQNSPLFSTHKINSHGKSDTVYTLEILIQTLEEAAYYLTNDN